MFIRSILFFSIFKLTILTVTSRECNCTLATTDSDKFYTHVLRRRMRAVVFPNKAHLVLTPAFTKAVLDGRPRGLFYSMEFDMYNPLPDTIEGWKPNVLLNNLKQHKATLNPVESTTKEKHILQKYTQYLFDSMSAESPYMDVNDVYNFPFYKPDGLYNSKREWTNTPNNLNGFASYFHRKPYLEKRCKRSLEFNTRFKKNPTKNYSDQQEIPYSNQSNRERRRLLQQLETVGKVFKFNMIKCIQRAMCELASNFRSYGESVMEDILRLILTPAYISYSSENGDNYGTSNFNFKCEQQFVVSCPYSVLDFVLKNVRLENV